MLLIVCIVIICCTVSINKKIDEISWGLWTIDYMMNNIPNYTQIWEMLENTNNLWDSVTNIEADVEQIRQDIDDIWYQMWI